jgi:hypothetical protein
LPRQPYARTLRPEAQPAHGSRKQKNELTPVHIRSHGICKHVYSREGQGSALQGGKMQDYLAYEYSCLMSQFAFPAN